MKSLVSGKSATQEQSENRPKNYIEFPDAFDEMNTNEGLSRKRVR